MYSPFSAQRYTSLRKDPIAFSGRNLVARYSYPKFKTQKKLEEALASVDTYTRHRSARRPKTVPYLIYSRRKLIGGCCAHFKVKFHSLLLSVFAEADLTDRNDMKSFNDGFAYWVIVIDAFSRKTWGRLIKRKTENEVVSAMEDIIQSMDGATVERCRTGNVAFN